MSFQNDLPESLAKSKTVDVLFRAVRENRCPHGILFSGPSAKALEKVCVALAGDILGMSAEKSLDFHVVRPENKSRTISMENVLGLVHQIQQTPSIGTQKAACVFDADRFGRDSANAFLKTLEEPPAGTFIFLTTTAVNRVLPTVRSRCLHFRIAGEENLDHPEWLLWQRDFENWISDLISGAALREIGKTVFAVYALTTRLQSLVKTIADEAWAEAKKNLAKNASDEQCDAMQAGIQRGIRRQILGEIQNSALRLSLRAGATTPFVAESAQTCALLEKLGGMLELNMQDGAVFEAFLLNCMRIWAKKKTPHI